MIDDCLKLTTYFGERDRTERAFVADAVLDVYGRHRVETSILLRGALGFGVRHHLRTDRLLTVSEDLPLVSIAVDRRDRIERVLEEVRAIRRRGLITLERARMLTGDLPSALVDDHAGEATKMTIYVGRGTRAKGRPVHVAVCDLLHRHGLAGATVLLGVDGTVRGERRRARFFGANPEVPAMIIAVGDGHTMAGVLPELGRLLPRPLVTLERVTVCKRDGEMLSGPPPVPAAGDHGLRSWQKVMVYSSEGATVDGVAQHEAIVRGLRRSGARGATVLRGVWGFHGDHAPHGDRFFQLRRNVPTTTIVIDRPEDVARSFAVIDEATRRRGLVTCETVPALEALTADARFGGLRLAPRQGP